MTKIVLASLWERSIYPNLGLGYLAAYLQRYGNFSGTEIEIIQEGEKRGLEKVLKSKADVVALTCTTPNYLSTVRASEKVKEKMDVPVLLGGPHISAIPETLPKSFDIAMIGEGEESFLELMQLMEKGKDFPRELDEVKGIAFREGARMKRTGERALIQPLDKIPFPARELLEMERYLKPQDILCTHELLRGTSLLSSRGCPYRCVYCQASKNWKFIRYHSGKYVAEEIRELYEKYGAEAVAVVDDLFISDKKRLQEIVRYLKEFGLLGEIKYLVDGRSNLINDEVMKLLKKMGAVNVALGIESGNERILNYLKKGTVTVQQNIEAIKKINEYGMGVYGQFMIGSPTETREEMLETKEFIKNPGIKAAHISITTPLPGTELWEECEKKGLVDLNNIDWTKFDMDPKNVANSFYINEKVPFKEFMKLYRECWQESMLKHVEQTSAFFSVESLGKALKKPGLAARLVLRLIKKRLLGGGNGR